MNFLAHIFLSFGDDDISIGNFIADSIQGNQYTHLPEKIQKGIVLHRAIDTFTDAHKIHKKSRKRLHKNQGHYSGVVIDVFYDHFLAKEWTMYADEPLAQYVSRFYTLLQTRYDLLPEPAKRMLPYMVADNWLLNYAHLEGIDSVLNGLYRRTGQKSNMNEAILDLKEHYDLFEGEFHAFFKELIIFSHQKFQTL